MSVNNEWQTIDNLATIGTAIGTLGAVFLSFWLTYPARRLRPRVRARVIEYAAEPILTDYRGPGTGRVVQGATIEVALYTTTARPAVFVLLAWEIPSQAQDFLLRAGEAPVIVPGYGVETRIFRNVPLPEAVVDGGVSAFIVAREEGGKEFRGVIRSLRHEKQYNTANA